MHTTSGLLDELGEGVTIDEAQDIVLSYVRCTSANRAGCRCAATPSRPTAAFIARDMPQLDAYLHYRMVDVSSIKELARRWYPRAYFASPAKRGGHRALADITESVQELRYYREAIFVPQPGPGLGHGAGDRRPARRRNVARACPRPRRAVRASRPGCRYNRVAARALAGRERLSPESVAAGKFGMPRGERRRWWV